MNWPLVKFKNVATIITGSTPTKSDENYNGNIPFVTPGDLGELSEISSAKVMLTKAGAESGRLLPANAVLVCCIGATIGKTGISVVPVVTNQQINSLIFDESKVYPKYAYYFCKTLTPILKHKSTSTTMPIVNKSSFSEIEIPLPPLPEQKRIATILDKADAIRCKRQQAIQLAEDFLRAVFEDMFGDPVNNPKGFPIGTIRDLVAAADYGTSAKASESYGEYPILRMGNITYQGGIDLKDLKYINIEGRDESKYLARKGDLLFNRTNSKELVGKSAVYDLDDPVAIAGYLIRVRANERGNGYYIAGYLNSVHGKGTLKSICKSIVGMANINAQEMQNIPIMLPPVETQRRYQEVVVATRCKLKKFNSLLKVTEELFSSVSHNSLSGLYRK